MRFHSSKYLYLGMCLFLSVVMLFLHGRKQGADENHYLSWGSSIFYDADLFLFNEFEALHLPTFFTPTGLVGELRNFGVAIFWLPFYGLASLFWPEASRGVDSPIQLLLINWSTFLYVGLAVGLMAAALRQYFSVTVTWLAITTVLLGTPLLFYTIQRPLSSHPAALFLASLFLYLWLSQPGGSAWRYFGLGILLGWLGVVATFNLVLALIPLTTLWLNFMTGRNWREFLGQTLLLSLGIGLGFLPQMLVWQALYGSLIASPYARQLSWFSPHLLEMLFSPFHGLFVYAPVLLLAPAGVFLFLRHHKTLAVGIGLTWLALIYVVSANLAWWAGASFGNRYFLVLTPIFALMIGALLHHSLRWLWAIGPGVAWTLGLWWQTLDGTLAIGEANFYPLTTLLINQTRAWRNVPLLLPPLEQHWLLSFPLPLVVGILLGSAAVYWLGFVALSARQKVEGRKLAYFFSLAGALLISFTTVLWFRSENQKARLAEAGLYRHPQRVAAYDPLDLSKSYLDRAKYYQATGRPELVLADLQAAAQAWFSPSRQIFDQVEVARLPLTQAIDLRYGSELGWLGYTWQHKKPASAELTLYWQKLAAETEATYTPQVRLLDAQGQPVWEGSPADPFPAHYIPKNYVFYDRLAIEWPGNFLAKAPLWLEVTFPAEKLVPETGRGEVHPGLIRLNNQPAQSENSSSLVPTGSLQIAAASPLSSTYTAGEAIGLLVTWRAGNSASTSAQAEVQFLDATGKIALRQAAFLFAQGASAAPQAQPDKFLLDTLCLDTPPSLAPGKYQLNLVRPAQTHGQPEVMALTVVTLQHQFQTNPSPTICRRLNSTRLQRQYDLPQPNRAKAVFSQLAGLQGYELNLQPDAEGLQAQLTFQWQSVRNNPPPAQPRLRLEDKAQAKIISEFSWTPVWGLHPTEYWFKDEIILDTIQFTLPHLSPGQYRLILEWQNKSNGHLFETEAGEPQVILEDFSVP